MKKLMIGLFTASMLSMVSCGGGELEEETTNEDSTVVEGTGEESTEVAFMGTDAGDYLLYGHTEFTGENAVSADSMMSLIAANGSFEGEVKVSIFEVCQKAGCWITFENPTGGDPVRVFFRDHFTIPIETATATEAILLGVTEVDTLDVEFQKHLLDDAKQAGEDITDEDYASITEDRIETTFDCEAILVKK